MTLTIEDKKRFQKWLKRNTKLTEKVISDTVSRLNRISTIITLQTNDSVDDFLFKLGKKAEFSGLSMSVKSQLRKAYKRYHQFSDGK